MKKSFGLIVIGLLIAKFSSAQRQELTVQSEGGRLYLVHTVTPKENWYSVGRMFNISPKEIAPFNGTTLENPLSIGESLKIPLTAVNFSQGGAKAADETFVALYHTVGENETVSRIAASHGNVSADKLQKWNHTGNAQPKPGAHLVIGYLKVKPALSSLAALGNKEKVLTDSAPKKADNKTESENANPVALQEEKKQEPVVEKPLPVVKKETKPIAENTDYKSSAPTSGTTPSKHFAGSYFSAEYNEGSKTINGTSGVFKSTSGWQDGKYYALVNNLAVGSIIKVSSPSTNKSIFAKVLGPLPDMKESAGLLIRISNAGASELGEGEGKFDVTVSF